MNDPTRRLGSASEREHQRLIAPWLPVTYWRWWRTRDIRLSSSRASALDRLTATMRECATRMEYTAKAMEEFAIAWEAMERRIDEDILGEYREEIRKRLLTR